MEAVLETNNLRDRQQILSAHLNEEYPYGMSGKAEELAPDVLADMAVNALISEVNLTPKPGLVDQRGSGAHSDLTLQLMHRSAKSLRACFRAMAHEALVPQPYSVLREKLGAIGRQGEIDMFAATEGCNTHKGAIWALGLLVAGASICRKTKNPVEVVAVAGAIARCPDQYVPAQDTNGSKAVQRYGVGGARGEAQADFPHVAGIGLPSLWAARNKGLAEDYARLDALMAIMAELDDTCVLHRGGAEALAVTKLGAREVLLAGGTSTQQGYDALMDLDERLSGLGVSPGGSGDLIAATLFLDSMVTGINL
jgi:triphosphoribosyl-dephospho-CoA synthase MdcB